MSEMPLQPRSFLPTFFSAALFEDLLPNTCYQISSKVRINSFRPGQVIQPEHSFPIEVCCVVQGQVRVVGPADQEAPTLGVLHEGEVFGWESVVRRSTFGSVRAAGLEEVITLGLTIEDFESILQELLPTLSKHVSFVEVYDVLLRFCNTIPTKLNLPDLSEVSRHIVTQSCATVRHWFGQNDPTFHLSSRCLWFVSSSTHQSLPIGTIVESIADLPQFKSRSLPIRLLGIDRTFLSAALSTGLLPAPDVIMADSGSGELVLARLEALAKTSVPKPLPNRTPKLYPAHTAWNQTFAESVVTAFWNACELLEIPYKPEFLRQWSQQLESQPRDRMDWYAAIADAFGLSAQTVKFPMTVGGISRLQTPALIQIRDELCVLYEVSDQAVVFAAPSGLMRRSSREIAAVLQKNTTGTAIVLGRQAQSRTDRFGWWWLIGAFMPQMPMLLSVLIASIVVQLLGLANPLLTQQIVDRVIINSSPGALPVFGILLMGSSAIEAAITVARTYLLNNTTNRVDLLLGYQIIEHLFNLPLPFFQKRPVGEIAARINELEKVQQFITSTFFTVVLDVLFSIIYVCVMLLYSGVLTFCVLATVPVIIGLTLLAAPVFQELIRKRSDQHAQMQSHLIEMLNGMFTVKSQRMEFAILATWRQQYRAYLKTGLKTTMLGTSFQAVNSFVSNFSSLLVLWVGSNAVLNGDLTLGQLIAFRIIAGYVTQPLVRLSGLWRNAQEADVSMNLLADVKNEPPEFSEADARRLALPQIVGHVQYDSVEFGFQPGQLQLNKVSIDIPAGTFVGVVGQSGSGKSTLLKLLPRYYAPMSGQVYIDDIDIAKINLKSLREQIGVVQQEPNLFRGTLRSNIAGGNEDVDEAAVVEAAKIAEAHDFILSLPDGYGTEVGERGSSLSGGQRQRIAIAAMVYRNPRLVILDEATSALDAETERRVVDNLMRRFGDTTCFFITHRLSNLRRADLILYMQSGLIVEQGSHLELMARRQNYYCLYQQQSQQPS